MNYRNKDLRILEFRGFRCVVEDAVPLQEISSHRLHRLCIYAQLQVRGHRDLEYYNLLSRIFVHFFLNNFSPPY